VTFTGDIKHMQVFYGLYGYGAAHIIVFKDITVTIVPTILAKDIYHAGNQQV